MLAPGGTTQDCSRTLGDIITEAIHNILQQPLDFVGLVENLQLKAHDMDVQLTSFGPAHVNMLARALSLSKIERFGSTTALSQVPLSNKGDYRDAIAIVGMACRVPGAQNVDELWELLMKEKDMHRQVPSDRFDVKTHYDPTGEIPNTTITQWGCFDDHVGDFDLALFKMSPREALQTDPCHRMMLITGYEALQDAGYYDPGSVLRPKFGTFYGQAGDDYRQVNSGQNIDTNYITGGIRAFAPGRVSYYFGWEGPSVNIDTACSSSAVAINQACLSLRLNNCDMALAGGVNLLTSSDFFAGLSRARFLSTTGPCKTLDETADGYCRGDGAGSIVIKRYQDALRDNDNILGVIRSIETAHAGTAISITHPEAETQIALFQNILSKIGMDVRDIDHVEMHGTGTQAGDLAETTSVVRLVEAAIKPRPANRPLTIASIKPNVGHSEGASGVTSLIKALLMFKHRINPRHIGIKTRLNPKLLPLADMGIEVPLKHTPYTPTTDKRRILVNNFNATGGVTAMVVEEHFSQPTVVSDPRQHYPIVLSAANNKSLVKGLEQMLEYLESVSDVDISHLSYSLTARRLHHSWCFSCVASDVKELVKALRQELSIPRVPAAAKRDAYKPLVFVFTGQGVSYVGMGRVLFNTNKTFREHIERSDALCRNMDLPSFLGFIDHDGRQQLSDFSTVETHLALVSLEIALAYLLGTWGIRPSYVLGHSLGEYSALCVSEALSVADTLYLVSKRAQLLKMRCRQGEYSMIATSLTAEEAQHELLRFPQCEVTCFNGPSQTVIGGENDLVVTLAHHLIQSGVKARVLSLDYAFHSSQMDAILPEYEKITRGITFKEPTIPLMSTCLGDFIHLEQLTVEYLSHQTRQPVKFHGSVEKLSNLHLDNPPMWMDLGPAPACTSFIDLILGTTDTVTLLDPKKPNWRTISNTVIKYYTSVGSPRWDYYHQEYIDGLRLIRTPAYPFDMARYWIQYEGDWSITKNRAPVLQDKKESRASSIVSTTLHRLESDLEDHGRRKLVFASDLNMQGSSEGDLYTVVDGRSLVASSLYVDMAMTAASELFKRSNRGSTVPALEFSLLSVFDRRPGFDDLADACVQVVATQNQSDRSIVNITITLSYAGKTDEIAECKITFGNPTASDADVEEKVFLYRSRMDLLEMFHKTTFSFSNSAIEHHLGEMTGLQEVILNPGSREAVANWEFQPAKGDFLLDPTWLNTLFQLPRFIVSQEGSRCTLKNLKSLRLLATLQSGTTYRVHMRLSHYAESATFVGNLHVFNGKGALVTEAKNVVLQLVGGPASKAPNQRLTLPHRDSYTAGLSETTLLNSAASPPESAKDSPATQPTLLDTQLPLPAVITRKTSPPILSKPYGAAVQASLPKPTSVVVIRAQPESSLSKQTISPITTLPHSSVSASQIDPSATNAILSILASELGVDLSSIKEDEPLEDLGVDSIMAMTLLARMQKGVGTGSKLPGTLLVEYNSFGKLRAFFEGWGK
jgi:acyl transferase domain-containing protein/acyl carrier protein